MRNIEHLGAEGLFRFRRIQNPKEMLKTKNNKNPRLTPHAIYPLSIMICAETQISPLGSTSEDVRLTV